MTLQQTNIAAFIDRWTGKGYEKGESQKFWIDLLQSVLNIANPTEWLTFEEQVKLDHTSFIDVCIPQTHVMIEQKSLGKDLRAPIKQSDGSLLNPFQQAKRYAAELPYSKRPRWIVTCNFSDFLVYDMEQPNSEPQHILLKNLTKEAYRLRFLVDTGDEHIRREMEVSMKAGEIIGQIYDHLYEQYALQTNNQVTDQMLHSLNMLCVRLVFCLYAEDAGIFAHKQQFGDYIRGIQPSKIRRALLDLFKVLDQKPEDRDPFLEPELKEFLYVNGGLFSEEDTSIPIFTDELKELLCGSASDEFDWSEISPTIFGAIFESTLNPETRRSGGMHYTSIENIHKVIDPLFLNQLRQEFNTIADLKQLKVRNERLIAFQDKLGSLNFLDPACGSGNFLTETFISLRRLENECLRLRFGDGVLGVYDDVIKVNIHQFYGIEINEFATTVAKTALWIAESQMMEETALILQRHLDFLPLKSYSNIVYANALQTDWATVIAPDNLHYIMGNPPFVGARFMSPQQKEDLLSVFGEKWKNVGNLDFVSAWYKKAMDMIVNTNIRCAFVSTNSICQGESVANLWGPLMKDGLSIDFAHRTFRWDSEAKLKAHVHCIIVGFSFNPSSLLLAINKIQETIDTINKPLEKIQRIIEPFTKIQRILYDESGNPKFPTNINAYLTDGPNVFIQSRNKPLCDVPEMGVGSQAIDDGQFMFSEEEKNAFIAKEPKSAIYFHRWFGADEFINNRVRYCLYLGDCSPAELRAMPFCMERVAAVRQFRLSSKRTQTLKAADWPNKFAMTVIPDTNYLLIPRVSSEKRRYIPIGFMHPDEYVNDAVQIIPSATLYHFGVLTSNVHMAWMRVVCGRLKSDYRYSKDIVYNNFPWPTPTEAQRLKIEKTAQAILDARAKYADSSLADLYDETTMPIELRNAHRANDRAVMEAYKIPLSTSESDCVAHLLQLYQSITQP